MGVISMRSSRIACWSRPASAPGRSGTRHQADVSATNRSSPPSSSATCIPLLVVVSQLLDVRERLAVEPPRVDDPLRKLGQSSSYTSTRAGSAHRCRSINWRRSSPASANGLAVEELSVPGSVSDELLGDVLALLVSQRAPAS
jgi:hypothetical protein